MHKAQTLFEYDHLCADPGLEGIVPIDESTFEALELFLASLAAGSEDTAEEMHDVFRLSSRRGRKTLAVQNYVGVISAADTAIEVLPKIGRPHRDSVEDVERVRSVFLSMLSELRDTQFKTWAAPDWQPRKCPSSRCSYRRS
ncbi:MAG: 5-methylcytosine restriction system specificity protein McrC [Adlercreutzia equolifaciens]